MFEQTFKNIDVILANLPFGGKECKEIQQNFPIKTGDLTSRESEAAVEEVAA